MIVPYEKLSQKALQRLIEEFVTKDGTDSGYTKNTLQQNVDMVKGQLSHGDAVVVYDEKSKTANIVPKGGLQSRKLRVS